MNSEEAGRVVNSRNSGRMERQLSSQVKDEGPARLPADGAVGVRRHDDEWARNPMFEIYVEHANGKSSSIEVSEFNARRIFGSLSILLGLPLSSKVGKSIKMG